MKQLYKAIACIGFWAVGWATAQGSCLPQINWGASISFCQGNSFTLSAANPNSTYLWSTGATTSSLNIGSSGIYWVVVTNPCGSASDTIEVIVDQPLVVNLGYNRSFCSSTPEVLSVPYEPHTFYQWNTGATGNQISVTQSGTYYLSATNACGTYSDTVTLTAEAPAVFSLGADVVKCTPGATTFSLPSNLQGTILWSDGSSGNSLSASASGTYWATLTNACGSFGDTVNLTYLLPGSFFLNPTVYLCTGGSLTINSPMGSSGHLWSTGSVAPSIQVTQPGAYWLRLSTTCGQVYDTVQVVNTGMATVALGADTVLCSNGSLVLDAGNPGSVFQWSTGRSGRQLSVSQSGSYWVGVDNGCGFVYDTIQVNLQPIPAPAIADSIYLCGNGTSQSVNAGLWGGNASFLWSDGFTGRIHPGFSAGSHWVKVKNTCDTVRKDFHVIGQTAPNVNLGKDTTLCANSLTLNLPIPLEGHSFYWSSGCNKNFCKIRTTGIYWVQVTNACGTFSDTIQVTLNETPRGITEDTIYKCTGSNVLLSTKSIINTSYQWSNGAATNSTLVSSAGVYWVSSTNNCATVNDTVLVIDVDPLSVDLGKDTTFCRPAFLTLDLSNLPADSIYWSTGATVPSIAITKSGTYWVEAYNFCGLFTDTISVVVKKGPVPVLKDTSFCQNGAVALSAYQKVAQSYQWSTGSTDSAIVVSQPGWYFVDIIGECYTLKDSAFVRKDALLPSIDLGPDTIFCAGTLLLSPGSFQGAHYRWPYGDTSQTFTVTKSGTYYVEVFNACNSVSDTIDVLITGAPSFSLGNTVRFCRGSVLNLNAQNPGCTYLWSTGDTTQTLSVSTAGLYWVSIANACGNLTDSVNVVVEDRLDGLSLGTDTIICQGDSVLLETQIPGVSTKWGNGSTTTSIFVKQTGDYWVEVSNSCGTWKDTVHVEVLDVPVFSLGNDTAMCANGGSVQLLGPAGVDSYLWNDGSTAAALLVQVEGTYWLTVSNQCFSYTDTINIKEEYPIEIELGPDTVLCFGESLFLDPGVTHYKLNWSDNTNFETREITRPGTYWVVAENSCGIFSDTITVGFDNYLSPAPEKITICRDDSIAIDLSGLNHDFKWWDGSVEKSRYFAEEGTYPIFITNQCGEFQKDYVVHVSNCDCPFFIANAFTPNGDGLNDEFKVGHSCDLNFYTLQIFNRWGQKVFESRESTEGWDGSFGGDRQPTGLYTYSIHYQWGVYGDTHQRTKTGVINLMR